MYERLSSEVLTLRLFFLRLARHLGVVFALIVISLAGGMVGYRTFAHMSWVDAFLNASMLLGGMGPVGDLPNDRAKIFAGIFALYAGLIFIISLGIVLGPIVHRIVHRLHADEDDNTQT